MPTQDYIIKVRQTTYVHVRSGIGPNMAKLEAVKYVRNKSCTGVIRSVDEPPTATITRRRTLPEVEA